MADFFLSSECAAEASGRPLLPITCGDLGSTPREVEKKLDQAFQLAQTWNCVLLLDEADIFLTQRSENDIARNALVSGGWWCAPRGAFEGRLLTPQIYDSLPPRARVLPGHPLPHDQPRRRL
jgi:hypothetical protein